MQLAWLLALLSSAACSPQIYSLSIGVGGDSGAPQVLFHPPPQGTKQGRAISEDSLGAHESALQRNAEARRQLAEVVARRHQQLAQAANRHHEVARTVSTQDQSRKYKPVTYSNGLMKLAKFIKKKKSNRKTTSDKRVLAKKQKQKLPKDLVEHLGNIAELEELVEELRLHSLTVFGRRGARRRGVKVEKRVRPFLADPRRKNVVHANK